MNEPKDEMIERIAEALRAERGVSPAIDARIMAMVKADAERGHVVGAIGAGDAVDAPWAPTYAPPALAEGGRRGGLGAAWGWVARPRTVRLSPLAGLALAAGIAAVAVLGTRATTSAPGAASAPVAQAPAPAPVAGGLAQNVADAGGAGAPRVVTFSFVAPDAKDVSVAGDFNDWTPGAMPLRRDSATGIWTGALPLAAGRYTYSFVVDGQRWVADPAAPRAADDFGAPSSQLVVGGR